MSKNSENKFNMSADRWVKCIARGGNMVATAITAHHLIEEARKRHKSSAAEIKALGEALMAGLLLASTCKQGERVSLSIKGDKFLRQAFVDAHPTGSVRGFLITREGIGQMDSQMGPWQNGLVSVSRLKHGEPEPYVGTVPNVTGHLAKDLTFYLTQSEQIPSAVGLAVNIGEKGKITTAGAFLVQVMPGASSEEISELEKNINNLESLAAQIADNANPATLLGRIFNNVAFTILDERPLQFECNCSRDRVKRALRLLGEKELRDMIEKDKGAKINCDFCNKNYEFSQSELEELI